MPTDDAPPLVLSLFPGGGLLDYAFEQEGFCIVRGPDVLWGGDIRRFHPPAGRFDGIIGGDPCQSHSSLANLVRAKGIEPSFPDLSHEYERVVNEARPAWFLRENVPQAPTIAPDGYDVRTFLLDNGKIDDGTGKGAEARRLRRFWFGVRDGRAPELLPYIRTAPGGGTAAPVTGRNEGRVGGPGVDYSPPKRSLEEMLRLQGLPPDWLEHQPWTMQAKRKIVGNGWPQVMGRALARAIKAAVY